MDRDGVINELIYYGEHGIVDSPFTVDQFRLLPGVSEAIKRLHDGGFKVVLISNQPGIAKCHFSEADFALIRQKMNSLLDGKGAQIDAEYYCLHHPEANVPSLRQACSCRKPKPGLIYQAAKDWDIDLAQSWLVGDGLSDITAGKSAGMKTILLGKMKCELCSLMDSADAHPDAIMPNLLEASEYILESGSVPVILDASSPS